MALGCIHLGVLNLLDYANMRTISIVLGLVGLAMCAEAAPINALGQNAATGFQLSGAYQWSRGWRFQVNSPGVTVWELGMLAPNAEDYNVTLWDVSTQTVLASVAMAYTAPDTWQFQTLATPVALALGSQYLVQLYSTSAGYYFKSTTTGDVWQPTGTIQYLDMKFCNGCTATTFPTGTLSNYMYGVPDIGYTVGASTVPEPGTYAMLGTGLLGLVALRRRKR